MELCYNPISRKRTVFRLWIFIVFRCNMENYSVLMAVYHGEKAEYFRLSTQSMLTQTAPTDDFVLICDGPLTPELDQVVEELIRDHSDVLQVIRLDANHGLAYALNVGLRTCKNDLVARMDSDDIALANRCELQLQTFREDPELAIVGGAIDEFEGTPFNVITHKGMPESHQDVVRYAKIRNPFNHPTVMFRKSAVLAVGSYPERMLHEDYALWSNLILAGYKVRNLPQTLCFMRVDAGMHERRGGYPYLKVALRLRWHLYQTGLSTLPSFLFAACGLTFVCLSPVPVRKWAYRHLLRRK